MCVCVCVRALAMCGSWIWCFVFVCMCGAVADPVGPADSKIQNILRVAVCLRRTLDGL